MAQQTINVGTAPNDGTGTPLRTAFQYTNSNFSELYTAVGPSGNNIVVPGNATITGDLTVDTSTLKVDSANNRVGINTASPTQVLTVRGNVLTTAAAGTDSYANVSTDGVQNSYLGFNNSGSTNAAGASNNNTYIGNGNNYGTQIVGNSNILASFGTTGVFNWYDGAGGTRMTLNSTGLGVGLAPANDKLLVSQTIGLVTSTTADVNFRNIGNTTIQRIRYNDATGTLTLGSAIAGVSYPVELGGNPSVRAVTIDSSLNVGIGVTPSAWSGFKALQVQYACLASNRFGAGNIQTFIGSNTFYDGSGYKYIVSDTAARYALNDNVHAWYTASSGTAGTTITDFATAKMTLNASGNLLVARTGAGLDNTSGVTIAQSSIGMQTEGNATQIAMNRTTSDGTIVDIRRNNSTVGTIAVTTAGTTYNSISDYRLKEAVQPLAGGLARVNALKPSIYKWKSNGSSGEGFIAHELAEVVPAAVTGEKDAVNEDGTVNPQGVDLSKVVPILVAAIKELTAEVNALKNA